MKLEDHVASFQSLILSTLDDEGYPFGSYAPFIFKDNKIYILISDIATHAGNLKQYPKASTLFIEDESTTSNIFARKRISLQCNTKKLDCSNALSQEIINKFNKKFDPTMVSMLLQLPDFHFYALTPVKGEAVFGFGKSYILGGEKLDELLPRSLGKE